LLERRLRYPTKFQAQEASLLALLAQALLSLGRRWRTATRSGRCAPNRGDRRTPRVGAPVAGSPPARSRAVHRRRCDGRRPRSSRPRMPRDQSP
jgi:hypothetical protein